MGANESRPRDSGDSQRPILETLQSLAEAAGALGEMMQGLSTTESSSSSALQRHQKRTFTFNVDASQDPHATNKAGIGGVLKNEKGEILRTFTESMELKDDITVAELTAIKRALEVFSKDKFKWVGQYDELIVGNDNETAVRLAKGEQPPYKVQISRLLGEIKTLVSAIGKVNFVSAGRENIRDAHVLANQGRNIVEESANPDIFQALAAGAAVAGLGVAAWNALRSPASSSSPSAWNAMRSTASSPSPSPSAWTYENQRTYHEKRTFKFMVDASIGEDLQDPYRTKKAGSGGVLRNEKGEFLCEFYQHLGEEADITAAELTAIKGALEVFCEDIHRWDGLYDELIVANDNDSAVRLAKGEQPSSKYRRLFDDIQTLVDGIKRSVSATGKVGFIEVERDDNREADALADKGRKHLGRRVVSYIQSF